MVHGVLCVTTTGIYLMLRWCVDNWGMIKMVRDMFGFFLQMHEFYIGS